MYVFNNCCDQCVHNKVCSIKDRYSEIGEHIKSHVDESDAHVKITVSCENYLYLGASMFRGTSGYNLGSDSITTAKYREMQLRQVSAQIFQQSDL